MTSLEIELTSDWIKNHEERKAKFLVKDPWNDPMVRKVGLYNMYIIDAIVESLNVTVEENSQIQLGKMNPIYKTLIKYITNYINTSSMENATILIDFCQTIVNRPINIIKWTNYKPDIRALDSPDECLSWLLM